VGTHKKHIINLYYILFSIKYMAYDYILFPSRPVKCRTKLFDYSIPDHYDLGVDSIDETSKTEVEK